MKEKKYKIIKLIVVMLMAAIVSSFTVIGNYIVPVLAVISAAAILFLLRRNVTTPQTDERIEQISGKASRLAYTATALSTALLGMVFIAMRKQIPSLELMGNILTAIACGSILIYTISFKYYDKK